MKQLEVTIMGQSYLLGSPEGGQALLQAAVGKVDAAMCKIRDAGKVKARDRIAVLAALNLAFDHMQEPGAADAPVAPAAPLAGQDDPLLRALVTKLDAALAEDGQLL